MNSLSGTITRANLSRIILPAALLIVIYLPALYDLVWDWANDPNYSHGFLVPLVAAWLVWQKRQKLSSARILTDRRGLILIIIGLAMFILGNGAAEYFTLRVSFVITLAGLIWYLLGAELLTLIWFELFFLLFMIPIPYVIYFATTFPMQLLASKITSGVMNLIGMGVVRQGNILHIQGYSLEVAEACSGIRSLISLLALGALYAQMTQKRFAGKLILFLSTIPIAVIGNVFRVMLTSLIAYTMTDQITEEPVHTLMGLSVFVVAFVLLFILGAILKRVIK